MNVCVMNCCSMNNKLPFILDHVCDNKSDIVALTETWLSSDETKNRKVVQECAAHGYTLFHVPRPCRKGGGVAILIKDSISVIPQGHFPKQSFEYMELLVSAISIHIRIVVIYRPPTSNLNKISKLDFIHEFNEFLESLSATSGRLLICGDFNINWLDKDDTCYQKLYKALETYSLSQHINDSTHKSGHLLDYIISDEYLVNSVYVSSFISDHCALHASLVCTRTHQDRNKITYRCLKNIDKELFSRDIADIDFKLHSNDVDFIVHNYNTVFTTLKVA